MNYSMPNSYYRQLSHDLAVLAITPFEFPFPSGGYVINRINVPQRFRHQGIGTSLMLELLTDVDFLQKDLYLTIHAYGNADDPNEEGLRAWYGRLGFLPLEDLPGVFHRAPRRPDDEAAGNDDGAITP